MRRLVLIACVGAVSTALVGAASGADDVGMLSIESGRGTVTLDVRGAAVLGRLTSGTIAVVDRTPNDAYVANVTGRRIVVQRRPGPGRLFIRGQGLRFRMVGGSYRIVIRGGGIVLSAVGKGAVWLDGEPRFEGDDVGIYSIDGTDCSLEPTLCTEIPDTPLRLRLGKPAETEPGEKPKPGGASR
jgi:hypothetical protein